MDASAAAFKDPSPAVRVLPGRVDVPQASTSSGDSVGIVRVWGRGGVTEAAGDYHCPTGRWVVLGWFTGPDVARPG